MHAGALLGEDEFATAEVGDGHRLQRVILVGDRGVLTSARIEQAPPQPSLFDERDLAAISSADYPGERLVVCKNPLLAEECARKRGA